MTAKDGNFIKREYTARKGAMVYRGETEWSETTRRNVQVSKKRKQLQMIYLRNFAENNLLFEKIDR